MGPQRTLVVAAVVVVVVVVVATLAVTDRESHYKVKGRFWTRYGGGPAPHELARRTSAAGKGVADAPWAETYWPPRVCGARVDTARAHTGA